MAFTPLKSEHARRITAQTGVSFIALMNAQGVEMPRNGQNDPLLPFSITYDTQIPNANVTYPVPGAVFGIVWAFPVNAQGVTSVGKTVPMRIFEYRKPRYPGRKP